MKNNSEAKTKVGLTDSILFSLIIAFMVIGLHQCYVIGKAEGWKMGFLKSYSFFMLVILLMVIRQVITLRRAKSESEKNNNRTTTISKEKVKSKRK